MYPALAGGFLTKGPPEKSQRGFAFHALNFSERYSQLVNKRSRRHSSDLRKLFLVWLGKATSARNSFGTA